ncbi:MAG: hypothetical protein V5A84_00650 [Planctomycetota bacterium]
MHTKFKRALYITLALIMLAGAAGLMGPIQTRREKYDLGSTPVKGVSPEMAAATQALGAFRGIMLDLVWIRLQYLKRQGRFFEMVQLSDMACKLAPHFTKVWQFHAWNLAFNVSVEISYLPDRWSWVKSGIEVLRDKAIPLNPQEPELYNELSRLYLTKVAGRKDDAHMFYKAQFGSTMHLVLGGQGTPEKLKKLKAAPKTRAELLKQDGVKELREECRNHGFDPISVNNFFTYLGRPESVKAEVKEVLESSSHEEAVNTIETYVRAQRLRDKYRLEPEKMLQMMRQYASEKREYLPFDWRSPYPHAIYWATRAVEVAQQVKKAIIERRKEFGITPEDLSGDIQDLPEWIYREIDYDRRVYTAFQGLVRHGRLVYNKSGELQTIMGPNYQYIDAMLKIYEKMLDKYGRTPFVRSVRASHRNFLRRMAVEMYLMGTPEKAAGYWKMWAEKYKEDDYDKDFAAFIDDAVEQWVQQMNQTDARRMVRGLLTRAFLYWGSNQSQRAARVQTQAQNLAREWNQSPTATKTARWRIPYEEIRTQVLMDILSGRVQLSESIVETLKDQLDDETLQALQEQIPEEQPRRLTPPEMQRRFRYSPDESE